MHPMIDLLDMELLDLVAESLPSSPPLTENGEATVADIYPYLSNEELDYVMSKYSGTMARGIRGFSDDE